MHTPPSSTIRLERLTGGICTIIFDNPPTNLIVPDAVNRLNEIVVELSGDSAVKVVILNSGVPGYFFNDLHPVGPDSPSAPPPIWSELLLRLSRAPFLSIACIRGWTIGRGGELSLACDLRCASRELAMFGKLVIGDGALPIEGAPKGYHRLVRRDRALEVVLEGNGYDANLAERNGWVTGTFAELELDGIVHGLATHFAALNRDELAATKARINRAALPSEADMREVYVNYAGSLTWPGF